jgi:hypothetical protein
MSSVPSTTAAEAAALCSTAEAASVSSTAEAAALLLTAEAAALLSTAEAAAVSSTAEAAASSVVIELSPVVLPAGSVARATTISVYGLDALPRGACACGLGSVFLAPRYVGGAECQAYILAFLMAPDIVRCACVSRGLRAMCTDEAVWRARLAADFRPIRLPPPARVGGAGDCPPPRALESYRARVMERRRRVSAAAAYAVATAREDIRCACAWSAVARVSVRVFVQ